MHAQTQYTHSISTDKYEGVSSQVLQDWESGNFQEVGTGILLADKKEPLASVSILQGFLQLPLHFQEITECVLAVVSKSGCPELLGCLLVEERLCQEESTCCSLRGKHGAHAGIQEGQLQDVLSEVMFLGVCIPNL